MSTTTEKKQNFLFDEIIGQGYDADVFMNFMADSKEDGTNIEKWTMVELMNIVNEFKSTNIVGGGTKETKHHEEQNNYQSTQSTYSGYNPAIVDNYQSAPPKTQYMQSSPNKNEETNMERYEREQRVLQQSEIRLQQIGNPQQNQASSYQYNSQPPSQQQQQQQYQQQQRGSQQGMQHNQSNMYQNQLIQKSNSNKKPIEDDDPFAAIQVKPAAFQSQVGGQNNAQNTTNFQQSNIPFDADLARLMVNQQYKNNDIWNIPASNQPTANNTSNNMWKVGQNNNNPSQSASTKSVDPFSMFNTPNTNNPQGPQNVSNNSNANLNNDPFDSFFSTSQPQVQKIPSQPPAAVQQNNPTQKITESDLDNFFMGVTSPNSNKAIQNNNANKAGQPQQNMNTAATTTGAVGAAIVGGGIAANKGLTQQKQQPLQNKNKNEKGNNKEDVAAQIKEPIKSISNKDDQANNDKFKSEKACKKSIATVVSVKPDIEVSIAEHQIVSGSLFSIGGSNIAIYTVKTLPFNWSVKRKYNDFIWLRSILIKMYPGIPIPPLPGKTMKSLDEKLVQRRKGYFESFLFEILSQPDLKSSKYITDFLSISDDKIFKQRVKETEKIVRPKNLNEIETTTGKITLNKNPECNAHSQHIADYFEQNDSGYEKLKKLSKQLMEGYSVVGNILHQMGDIFTQLHTNVANYDSKTMPPIQVKELEETYKIMNNMCVVQANSYQEQIKIFSNNFYNFFKFHKDNLTGLKEIVKTRNELSAVLAKKDSNESSMLSGIFRSSKESVNHPSKILKELDEQTGYYNEQMLQSSKKILENRAKTYSKHFMTYCNTQKSIVTQMGTVWQDISDHFNNVLNGQIGKTKIEIMKKAN